MTKTLNVSASAATLAEENDVDLTKVEGTGTDGKITKPDVENFIAALSGDEDDFDDLEADDSEGEDNDETPAPAPKKKAAKKAVKANHKKPVEKSESGVFTYIGGGEDSPNKINFMSRQVFVRGKAETVTDPVVLSKVSNNSAFVAGKVDMETLHDMDEAAKAEADATRAEDKAIDAAYKKKHG